jgi:hypothetical protein
MTGLNGNSFSDCSLWIQDAPSRYQPPLWKFNNSQAAAMRGAGLV